jgi:hypothetical protein
MDSMDQKGVLQVAGCPQRVVDGGESYLLEQWGALACDAQGYEPLDEDEFLERLDHRQMLELLVRADAMSEDGRMQLAILDDRFAVATLEIHTCIWGVENAIRNNWSAETEWWYWRIPKSGLV